MTHHLFYCFYFFLSLPLALSNQQIKKLTKINSCCTKCASYFASSVKHISCIKFTKKKKYLYFLNQGNKLAGGRRNKFWTNLIFKIAGTLSGTNLACVHFRLHVNQSNRCQRQLFSKCLALKEKTFTKYRTFPLKY